MNTNTQTTTVRLLTAVAVMQGLTLMALWTGQPGVAPAAAAIPDPGAQREQMVEQQKKANEKLDKLYDLLSSGKLKVKVEEDKK